MSERPWFREKYYIDSQGIRHDLYVLLTIFLSSEKLVQHRTYDGDPIDILIDEFERSEIFRILTSTAIYFRIHDDQKKTPLKKYNTKVGELRKDIRIKKGRPGKLSLREACNKIIHATEYNVDLNFGEQGSSLNPLLYLYGEKNKTKWKATLDITEFVKWAEALTK